MRDVEELKEKASEILTNAAEAAEAVAEKAIEVGVPVAQKTLDATKSKLDDLEAHGEAALSNLEKHSKAKSSHGGRKALGWSLALPVLAGLPTCCGAVRVQLRTLGLRNTGLTCGTRTSRPMPMLRSMRPWWRPSKKHLLKRPWRKPRKRQPKKRSSLKHRRWPPLRQACLERRPSS